MRQPEKTDQASFLESGLESRNKRMFVQPTRPCCCGHGSAFHAVPAGMGTYTMPLPGFSLFVTLIWVFVYRQIYLSDMTITPHIGAIIIIIDYLTNRLKTGQSQKLFRFSGRCLCSFYIQHFEFLLCCLLMRQR